MHWDTLALRFFLRRNESPRFTLVANNLVRFVRCCTLFLVVDQMPSSRGVDSEVSRGAYVGRSDRVWVLGRSLHRAPLSFVLLLHSPGKRLEIRRRTGGKWRAYEFLGVVERQKRELERSGSSLVVGVVPNE